ncbi:uncharacterized protein N7506_001450 [Penicillium brevicompactum]|uniref:uncharacterized protein n=1 Tax=Penicillium brevicompactum TaxID=5074 RepID=UPI002540EB8B|nr:uncharacterized protein N7506_001450 [Penicillium brevicompactum]KAJ5348197.1 hypothetical protein N7506_001450 [Penicillium brevicompactum]
MAQSLPSLPKSIPSALVMWKDMSPYDARLRAVSPSSPRILVIGGGVTGLITSWALLDKGYHVTILSKEWASYGREQRLTSQIAGALWEFPQLSASGVSMKPADFFFFNSIEKNPGQRAKMEKIMASGLIKKYHINPQCVVDAYEHLAPVIDTDQCMEWLMKLVRAKGAMLVKETLQGNLLECEEQLRRRFQVDVILNATGLAGELAGDTSCYPIRGGLIRVINDGLDFPKVEAALSISADAAFSSDAALSADAALSSDAVQSEHGFVFLLPRNDDILLIGGIAEPHEWNLDLTLDSPIIKRMRERCETFLPSLKSARLDPDYPLAQGLRPFRAKNVRVERELRRLGRKPSRIVHSYGQGGAGWSLCFGCASDALALIEEALLDLEPMPMASLDSSCPMLSQTMQAHL